MCEPLSVKLSVPGAELYWWSVNILDMDAEVMLSMTRAEYLSVLGHKNICERYRF